MKDKLARIETINRLYSNNKITAEDAMKEIGLVLSRYFIVSVKHVAFPDGMFAVDVLDD
jgi:hypothetical protein